MKHIACYVRVSTIFQTVDNQRIRLIEYAERNGYTYDLYEEVESTRKTRPVKQQLLAKLRSGEYSAIVVYKLDRYARSSRELILEVQELIDRGIGFISITDALDFSTASGRLHFTILSAFAQFERDLIRDRTLSAMQRLKANGHVFTGRRKGSKDRKKRKTDGYFAREEKRRQMAQTKIAPPANN